MRTVPIGSAPGVAASEAEREKAAETFVPADVHADGGLTLAEFTTLIDLTAEDDLGRAATLRRFGGDATACGRIDAGGDGIVTRVDPGSNSRRLRAARPGRIVAPVPGSRSLDDHARVGASAW